MRVTLTTESGKAQIEESGETRERQELDDPRGSLLTLVARQRSVQFPESYVERLWAVRHTTAASAAGHSQYRSAPLRLFEATASRAGWGKDAVFP